MLETALSLLEVAMPLVDGGAAAGSSSEDRKVWLAAVARLAIRVVAVLEGAAADADAEEDEEGNSLEQHGSDAFEGGKAAPAQQLPLTLSTLLAVFDVRCVVWDRNRRESARHLAGLALARRGAFSKREREREKRRHP